MGSANGAKPTRGRGREPGIFWRLLADGKTRVWDARWEGPRKPDGKRTQCEATFDTEREAIAHRRQQVAAMARGEVVARTGETVGDYLTRWLVEKARGDIEPTSIASYETALTRRLADVWELELSALTALHINACYQDALVDGISAKTLRQNHSPLVQAMEDAARYRLIARNVARDVKLPTVVRYRPPVWTAAEVARFVAGLDRCPGAALWRLALVTGMRMGELLALRWARVDLAAGIVAVRLTLKRTGGEGKPKSAAGIRDIPIGPRMVDALRTHREGQAARRAAARHWWEEDRVFDAGDGTVLQPGTAWNRFVAACDAAGVPRVRPHDLRHLAGTQMVRDGVPLPIVKERMGHSSIQITADLYVHPAVEDQRTAARLLEAAFWDSGVIACDNSAQHGRTDAEIG